MERFDYIVSELGEHAVQNLLENWERFSGIRYPVTASLNARWAHFLRVTERGALSAQEAA